jgi:hypothetical protein
MPILANGVFYFPSHRRGKMSIGEYFIEPQEPPFKIIPGPLCYLRVSSSLVGHFSQHSESLCAFASKGCLMIIIIFCRHDSILTQGWRDKQQRATDGRAEVDPVSWTPICLSFGVHDPNVGDWPTDVGFSISVQGPAIRRRVRNAAHATAEYHKCVTPLRPLSHERRILRWPHLQAGARKQPGDAVALSHQRRSARWV